MSGADDSAGAHQLPSCQVNLVNVSKDSIISMDSIQAKLGRSRLMADIEAAEGLMGQGCHLEVIQKLAAFSLKRGEGALDRDSQLKALTLLKVRM